MTTQDTAPDFTLPGLDGLRYGLHEALDKGPVLLAFWHAHCGACKTAAPYLNRLYDAYENIGWSFWAIAQDSADEARAFVEQHGFRPTVLIDRPEFAASDAYDPEVTPTLYLVAPDGRIELTVESFDKAGLNELSRLIAGYTASEYVEVAPEHDGVAAFKPG